MMNEELRKKTEEMKELLERECPLCRSPELGLNIQLMRFGAEETGRARKLERSSWGPSAFDEHQGHLERALSRPPSLSQPSMRRSH
jgi:hypothetical protein